MKVGLLTGGGDCPGLNAVIRAVVQQVANQGGACVGILEGWRGLVQNMIMPLSVTETDGIIGQGGSILGSSRTNPYRNPETELGSLRENFARFELDAFVVIGGDDTLGVAIRLHNDFMFPVVGIPKTIDNDLMVDGLFVRIRHSCQHRDGGRRSPAHNDRKPPPNRGRRDDGPALRLDRLLLPGWQSGQTIFSSRRFRSTCRT